jgi:hypothetical protein
MAKVERLRKVNSEIMGGKEGKPAPKRESESTGETAQSTRTAAIQESSFHPR